MYRTGHLGIAMLVYAPLGTLLLTSGRAELALLGGAGMYWLASFPDCDHRLPLVSHRGATHTVGFALLVGGALGLVGWTLGSRIDPLAAPSFALFGVAIGGLSVLAHLLGDVLTPMGITPFWPVWNRTFSLSLTRADNTAANYAFLILGVAATAGSLLLVAGRLPV